MCIYTHPPNQPLLVLVPLLGSWRNRQRWHFQLLGLAKRAEISWQILHQRLDVNQQISHGKNQRLDVNQQISHGKMKDWKIYGKMYPSIFCQPLGYIWYIDGYWKNKKPRFEWRLKIWENLKCSYVPFWIQRSILRDKPNFLGCQNQLVNKELGMWTNKSSWGYVGYGQWGFKQLFYGDVASEDFNKAKKWMV